MTNYSNCYAEADQFLQQVSVRLEGSPNQEHSSQLTTAVLHSLRDRISYRESMFLVANLPVLIKGIYFDGWNRNQHTTTINSIEDFLEEIRRNAVTYFGNNFSINQLTMGKARAVIQVLRNYVCASGFWHVRNQLPAVVSELFNVEEAES